MSSGGEVRVLSQRCVKLRRELSSIHEALRKSKLKTLQQGKELEELGGYNALLRKKTKEHETEIKRLKKTVAKTRAWKRKAKTQSELIQSLKGDIEFLEKVSERDCSESQKYRRATEKRLGEIAQEREDAKDMLFKEKILHDCVDIEKEELITKLRALTAMNDELSCRNNMFQEENLELMEKIERMEHAHFEEVKTLSASLDDEISLKRQTSRTHEETMQEKEFALNTMQNELEGAEAKLELMRHTSISHEECLEKLADRNEEVEKENRELRTELQRMRKQKDFHEDEASALQMELDAETSRVKEMRKTIVDKKLLLKKVHAQTKSEQSELQKESSVLRDQLRQLNLQFDEIKFKYHTMEKKMIRADAVSNGLQMQILKKERAHTKEMNDIFSEVHRTLAGIGELSSVVDLLEPSCEGICIALKRIRARIHTLRDQVGTLKCKDWQLEFDLQSTAKKVQRDKCIQRIQQNLDLALAEAETSVARDRLKAALNHDRMEEIILKREVADLERQKSQIERDLGLLHI